MDRKKVWLHEGMKKFKESTLATTTSLGVIQIIVEKLVDVEFACPCDAITNGYTILFFIAPPFIVVLLMFAYKLKSKSCESCTSGKCLLEALKSATFPAIIWLVIVLLDGCYLACFWTNWSGKYEMIENAAPQRWCKPANSSEILLARTQLWYSQSQYIGFITAGVGVVLYLVYLAFSCFPPCSEENEKTTRRKEEDEEASAAL